MESWIGQTGDSVVVVDGWDTFPYQADVQFFKKRISTKVGDASVSMQKAQVSLPSPFPPGS